MSKSTSFGSPRKSDKTPNVYEFLKYVQKKIYVHPFKSKRRLKNVNILSNKLTPNFRIWLFSVILLVVCKTKFFF